MQATGSGMLLTSIILAIILSLAGGFINLTFDSDFSTTGGDFSNIPEPPETFIDAFSFPTSCINFFWNAVTFNSTEAPLAISLVYTLISICALLGIVLIARGGS